jgi:hypothetical protein
MSPAKTAEQISSKYQRRVAGAGQDYAEGVQSPARDWSTATIAAKARWQTALQEAMQAGRYERGVQAAGTQKWQQRALNVGAQRYTGAAAEAAAAFNARAGEVLAAGQAAAQAAGRLPNTTYEQRKQRALAAMDAIHAHWAGRK